VHVRVTRSARALTRLRFRAEKNRLLPGFVTWECPVGVVTMTVPSASWRSDQPGQNVLSKW
jgi:hypothetical protein